MTPPDVTVLMASYNSAAHVGDALASILAQTLRTIEVVVVDDGSTDGSAAIVAAVAGRDGRVRLVRSPCNGGPAKARNLGLDQARGRWVAVVDSDDLIHPDRLERLLATAEAHDSDIAADNLLVFDEDPAVPPYAFGGEATEPLTVDLAGYVLANAYGRGSRPSGYLKPLFRMEFVRQSGVRYQPELLVAQDFSFVRALLGAGARFHVFPGLTYFYRKHAGSNSHRLTRAHIEAMVADDARFLAQREDVAPDLLRAFAARRRGFRSALAFDDLVQAIKTRRWRRVAVLACQQPGAAAHMWQPLADRVGRRRWRWPPATSPSRPQVCMVARTMSASLRDLAEWFAAAGADAHLVLLSATEPNRSQRASFRSVAVQRRGLHTRSGEGWSTADKLFIARHARPVADIVVVEGSGGVDALPFVLRPGSPALVLVDRLPAQADRLSRADAIVTLRPEAAAMLREACRRTAIILLMSRSLYDAVPLPFEIMQLLGGAL